MMLSSLTTFYHRFSARILLSFSNCLIQFQYPFKLPAYLCHIYLQIAPLNPLLIILQTCILQLKTSQCKYNPTECTIPQSLA